MVREAGHIVWMEGSSSARNSAKVGRLRSFRPAEVRARGERGVLGGTGRGLIGRVVDVRVRVRLGVLGGVAGAR